jgi:hypothetical protein
MTSAVEEHAHLAEHPLLRAASPVDPFRHTMTYGRLMEYLRIKVHHLVDEQDWSHIVVAGSYDRTGIISTKEKNDKLFNWQRPTARVGDNRCFPGWE